MKRIYMDLEFTGLHQKTTLVSIGLISDCGKTFYAESTDFDSSQIDEWLQDNVIDKLLFTDKITAANSSWEKWISEKGIYDDALGFALAKKDMSQFECIGAIPMIQNRLEKWFEQFDQVHIWSDCLSYDWVLFCEIFGGAFKIPKNIYYIPFDICPLLLESVGDADINRELFAFGNEKQDDEQKHNALWDAKVIRACHNKLIED